MTSGLTRRRLVRSRVAVAAAGPVAAVLKIVDAEYQLKSGKIELV